MLLLTLAFNAVAQQPDAPEALTLIESSRGGRHWIDDETADAKSPAQSLRCFQLEPGLKIELVACEPLVMDPVAIAFDHLGRMFVVEYGDYPTGPAEGGDALSRIVLLEDTNGDGQLDKRQVFADKLTFAHSLMPYNGGLLVAAQTELLFLKDTTGDNKSDQRQVVFEGFVPAHPQMQVGHPRWGIDNWIYLNYGAGDIAHPQRPNQSVKLSRTDFRFHPTTLSIEPDGGLGQFGNTIDRWGQRVYCSNRNPIMATMFPEQVLRRNPLANIPASHYDVGKSGGETRVYPIVEMKSNYLSHAGSHTAACGVTANLGDKLGPAYANSVFVCEPIGHLVTHSIVEEHDSRLRARRARDKREFIASSDTWFRPTSLANGPDGAIYLADMYRLWVEHPNFLPPEIAERIDWRAGEDRGRIYRIIAEDSTSDTYKPPRSRHDLVDMLQSQNAWRQFVAQRLLVERHATDAAAALRKLLTSDQPTTRLHAMWTLDGIGELRSKDVIVAMNDADSHVRLHAARISVKWPNDEQILSGLVELADDPSIRVQLQVMLSLGEFHHDAATRCIADIATLHADDPWMARGMLTTAKDRAGPLLRNLFRNEKFVATGSSNRIDLVRDLAEMVGIQADTRELKVVLDFVTRGEGQQWWRAAAINGLGKGLPRHRGELGRMTLADLVRDPPTDFSGLGSKVGALLRAYEKTTLDKRAAIADRVAAVELLSMRPLLDTKDTFARLFAAHQPSELQRAALHELASYGSADAAKLVLEQWAELAPSAVMPATTMLLRRKDSTRLMLSSIADGTMSSAQLTTDQRVRLLKHSDDRIRAAATELLGGSISPNRRAVAAKYAIALDHDSDAGRGQEVFKRVCSNCHKINGMGHDTGPDLSDVRNRSKLSLLHDILDPNLKVEPQYTAYSIVTNDGVTFSGLVTAENAESVVLKLSEGKSQTIQRDAIELIQSSRVSLMPEGIEKDVSVQEMADLLDFLKQ